MNSKIIIFDIYSEYGHFRKFNTTVSKLTYSIPPRTSVIGFLAAILGYDRFSYHQKLNRDKIDIAVQILNPIKKQYFGFKLVFTKDMKHLKNSEQTLTNFEFLKNPKFRIYAKCYDKNLESELFDRIKQNKSFYTPYMGISQLTANFDFIDFADFSVKQETIYEISTAINMNRYPDNEYMFEDNFYYSSMVMPVIMEITDGNKRITKEFSEILFENYGKAIKLKNSALEVLHNEYYGSILFL